MKQFTISINHGEIYRKTMFAIEYRAAKQALNANSPEVYNLLSMVDADRDWLYDTLRNALPSALAALAQNIASWNHDRRHTSITLKVDDDFPEAMEPVCSALLEKHFIVYLNSRWLELCSGAPETPFADTECLDSINNVLRSHCKTFTRPYSIF